jgi:drug/metabolite transporter, DME family
MRYGTGAVLVLVAGVIWSLMSLLLRQIESPSTWAILFWRSAGTIPVLLAFMAWQIGGNPLRTIRQTGLAGVLGGLALIVAFAGSVYAVQSTTVANAVFLFTASPFVAALLGMALLGEPVRPATWAAMAIAVLGMFVMVREGLAIGALAGNIAAILSAVGFGAFAVMLRWGRVADSTPIVLLGALFTMVVSLFILSVQGQTVMLPVADMAWALLMGACCLAVGMVLFTIGSRVVPAAESTLLSFTEIMLAPVWVWLFLGESASTATFIGGAILLAAVVLNAVAGARRGDATQGVASPP